MEGSNPICDCSHSRQDHAILEKKMNLLAYFDRGILLTPQWDYGKCKKCTCPKYDPPKLFRPKRNMVYQAIPKEVSDDAEKRCQRCGTLFENHSKVKHPFTENKE